VTDNILRFDFLAKDQASPTFQKVGKQSDGLQAKLGKFGHLAVGALAGAGAAMGGLAVAGVAMGVKTAAAMEQAQVGFTTLLGSGQKAQSFLANLKKFAAATPFDLPGLVDSSRLLIGVGLSAKDTMGVLQNFGDAAGAVGVSQVAFQRIMLATSQAISAGKFQAGDLNQITEAGIPIWKILSEAMGKPVTAIRAMSSSGDLLASTVLPLLNKQMHKDYGGAMAKQSQTLNGQWSTFMDTLNQGLGNVIQPLIPALDKGLAGATKVAGAALKGLPGVIDTVTGKFSDAKDLLNTKIKPAFTTLFDGIKTKLPKIDISAIGASFKTEAAKWGGDIITGVQAGFHSGNWGPLGKTLGEGLSTALTTSLSGASKLGAAVGKWIGGVDWFGVGEDVGKQAFPFIVGFSTTLVTGLINVAKQHPMDTVLFILSLIPIGKFAAAFGPLRDLIEHLPLGKWFVGLLDKTAVPIWDGASNLVKGFFRVMGKAFIDEFPNTAKALDRGLTGLADGVRLRAMYMADRAKDFIDGVATGIGRGLAGIVKAGGRVVKLMLDPYIDAGKWLVNRGLEFVSGLVGGIGRAAGSVTKVAGSTISRMTRPFVDAGSWLLTRGRQFVGGLVSGIGRGWGSLSSAASTTIQRVRKPFTGAAGWLFQTGRQLLAGIGRGMLDGVRAAGSWAASVGGKIVSAVKGYFGIKSPSTRMMAVGRNLITSVFKAMVDHNPVPIMGKIFGGMPEALGALADKGLIALKNLPKKALNALGGLGGAIGGKISGLLGLGGAKLGGGLSAAERWIIMHESGGRTSAQNPTSTAFGLGQLLIANRVHYGKILGVSPNTTNYNDQLSMFRMYVRDRYGNANNAQAFWESHGWYGTGGLVSKASLIGAGEKGPERVLSARQTASFEQFVRYLPQLTAPASTGTMGDGIDYRKLGKAVAAEFAGMSVTMDGKAVGRVQGHRTSLLVRGG
jgi:tape measure domain-containing protein